jgi:hypothetical protein
MHNALHPVAGIDYPETYQEFLDWFDSEESCRLYLRKCRWPAGFICSRCGSVKEPWITSRGYLHCRECQHEVSVTAGTIFHRTRMPLRTWFAVAWFVTSQKDGASALGLQNALGLQSYQTAWTCLHKLRSAMVRPGRDQLSGRIEVDESYFGGRDEGGKRGRGSEKKAIVAIAVELHSPKGFGRIRMQRIPDVTEESLIPFVCGMAKTGSEIRTDGWASYNALTAHGYLHHRSVISESGDPAHISIARSTPCRGSGQALVTEHTPRCRMRKASRLLSRLLYISIQSTVFNVSWSIVSSPYTAGRRISPNYL